LEPETAAATNSVPSIGREAEPKFFWGGARRQGHGHIIARRLDPDGRLARFVRRHEVKKRARFALYQNGRKIGKNPAAYAALVGFTHLTTAG
jgi:hypothetical protein